MRTPIGFGNCRDVLGCFQGIGKGITFPKYGTLPESAIALRAIYAVCFCNTLWVLINCLVTYEQCHCRSTMAKP
ncbi:MAG: hypothetical protein HWQ23_05580 [Nostoc sp. JL33]|uniref:hypothetical protein n=1 Tax=Nostoc sp. JL33 TaxID=2815396 RepID=UPI0025E51DD5|nr:hypothetical protein [Nostoc sp. JL33]MBN3869780.1 hypothetical protein [Nostoc sp. JL33]